MIETKTEHEWFEYGRWFSGYGSSMDPHICGEPGVRCVTTTSEREVSDWKVVMTREVIS